MPVQVLHPFGPVTPGCCGPGSCPRLPRAASPPLCAAVSSPSPSRTSRKVHGDGRGQRALEGHLDSASGLLFIGDLKFFMVKFNLFQISNFSFFFPFSFFFFAGVTFLRSKLLNRLRNEIL